MTAKLFLEYEMKPQSLIYGYFDIAFSDKQWLFLAKLHHVPKATRDIEEKGEPIS